MNASKRLCHTTFEISLAIFILMNEERRCKKVRHRSVLRSEQPCPKALWSEHAAPDYSFVLEGGLRLALG